MLKRRQMCTAECSKILRRYNEMRLTSNDQRRRPSPTPKYRGSGLKRLTVRRAVWSKRNKNLLPLPLESARVMHLGST